jgi:hypothetical protein
MASMNPPSINCSLGAADGRTRKARWQAVADAALLSAERTAAGARQRYCPEAAVEREITELIALEGACCSFLDFRLARTPEALVLDVAGPPEAAALVELWATARPREGQARVSA